MELWSIGFCYDIIVLSIMLHNYLFFCRRLSSDWLPTTRNVPSWTFFVHVSCKTVGIEQFTILPATNVYESFTSSPTLGVVRLLHFFPTQRFLKDALRWSVTFYWLAKNGLPRSLVQWPHKEAARTLWSTVCLQSLSQWGPITTLSLFSSGSLGSRRCPTPHNYRHCHRIDNNSNNRWHLLSAY